MSPEARFAFAVAISAATIVALFQIFDPNSLTGIGHAIADILGRHPFEMATIVIQPLAVKTKDAWTMLGCSNAHGYNLIAQGELDSYLDGRVRKVTVESIRAYIERKLAAAKKHKGPKRTEKATAARMKQYANGVEPPRRGKQRKSAPPAAPITTEEATSTT
jgi:hypothetical protein